MDIEYGGSRSFKKYMMKKEEKIPLSYNKKYSAEIGESYDSTKKGSLLFMNCNFYIDDFVSLFSLYNSSSSLELCDDMSSMQETVIHPSEQKQTDYSNESNFYINDANDKTIDRYYTPMKSQDRSSTCYDYEKSDHEKIYYWSIYKKNNTNKEEEIMNKTPIKSTYNETNTINSNTCNNNFDNFMKSYQNVSSCKRNIHASYINKKEQLEILIVQNGGIIHNALTSKVTHIISNNMALGSKKYMDYKKAVKRSKVFIVVDKYIFDCVTFRARLPEQSYIPSLLRYNSHQITEYFSFKGKRSNERKVQIGEENNQCSEHITAQGQREQTEQTQSSSPSSTPCERSSSTIDSICKERLIDDNYVHQYNEMNGYSKCKSSVNCDSSVNSWISASNHVIIYSGKDTLASGITARGTIASGVTSSGTTVGILSNELKKTRNNYVQNNKHLQILNMQMNYENLKKYIVYNSTEYFKRLQKYYLDKELKENVFTNVSANLHINKNNFEEFCKTYKILDHLSEQEIKWIKHKSELNINIQNVWENDIIHFFFDIALKKRRNYGSSSSSGGGSKSMMNPLTRDKNGMNVEEKNKSESNHQDSLHAIHRENIPSEKLIDSVHDYFYNSRLYILGNWNYISKVFFNFEDIKEKDSRKFVYLYIDFDNYFLNASLKSANFLNCKKENLVSEILCVCHSLKKEESYGIISATNYWGKKNRIFKGMIKGEVTKVHKNNIHFIKYDFTNILKSSFLFLLVLINYSKNVRVLSVDESILQLFYENEQDIFLISKQISDDIYNLTNLTVSMGISSDLGLSRKALKFCKKRFLFFDFYHHLSIFIGREQKRKKKRAYNLDSGFHPDFFNKSTPAGDTQGGAISDVEILPRASEEGEDESNNKQNNYEHTSELLNYARIEKLFEEYILFEEERKEILSNENEANERYTEEENNYFLNAMRGKVEKEVDLIFDKFIQLNKDNLEDIINTFFERVTHPISKYFFFYKKNEYYLEILKKLNYLSGDFIYFNIYYFPAHTEPNSSSLDSNKMEVVKNEKKNVDKFDEKRSINISVNYGVRFQKINDFYYLIYFMTKQLYIRLKIKNLKAKSLSVHFFIKEENENVNPIKYLGRGKVIRISTKIKLSHYTNCFFVYFFKIIYSFDVLANNLAELRGVQIVCSDVVNHDTHCNHSKKSILYYFNVSTKGGKVSMQESEVVGSGTRCVNGLAREEEKKEQGKGERKGEEKKESIIWKNKKCHDNAHITEERKQGGEEVTKGTMRKPNNLMNHIVSKKNNSGNINKKKSISRSINKKTRKVRISCKPDEKSYINSIRNIRNILSYFLNTSIQRGDNEKNNKIANGRKPPIPFSFENCAHRNIQKKNCTLVKRKCASTAATTPKKIKITKNFKIYDFFPNIIVKKKKENNIRLDDMSKKCINENVIIQTNIFDSIINRKIKKENHVKEEVNCCYLCYMEIREDVMEKQKINHDNDNGNGNDNDNDFGNDGGNNNDSNSNNCKEQCANNIFCYTYISNCLHSINQKNEKFVLYMYIKKIISSYISYFNNAFHNHNCCNKFADQYYLYKFMAYVIDNVCEELHSKRFIDVLHIFLKNFKYIWCLNKKKFPPLLHRTLIKYNVQHQLSS
ncbi:DNA repair protein REV1, putative [Plasmodium malariae]|uniref:DNA repair protein REV1, putative n=1 Tax=Plasmodium malariae TaxID=5858 RepID=A0A1C3KBE6_PLAMA|nr:DNA repair protein REV1, putative [Plasmodium malariae]